MYRLGTIAVAAVLAVLTTASSLHAQTQRPNVVFIMTDDVGYGDIGSYGGPDIKTPHLDQLARDGTRFTDFYANAPVCTPTRAGFVTGRYQQRAGLERPFGSPGTIGGDGLAADGRTLPQLLKNGGYATALIGKWHLGYEANQLPNAHGFDYFFGFRSGYVDYYQHTGGDGNLDLWENDQPIEVDGYLTDIITERSVDYIRENADRPFFLSVQYNAAHWPYQRPDAPSVSRNTAAHLQPHSEDTSTREDYVAMLERADEGIGSIVQALADAGVTDNTLLVFTNDNGGEWLSRNAPLFNRKGTVWEGGIRVPAIMKWPGVIPSGRVTDQVGITMDVTATILAVTGAPMPDDLALDGMNLLPILTGESLEVERTLFWRGTGQRNRAVRSGDWKLVIQDLSWGTASFVYNVRTDVGERDDVAKYRPDVARRLRGLLNAWEAEVNGEAEARGLRAPR
jgi:arylsulfatase A-like enzyme